MDEFYETCEGPAHLLDVLCIATRGELQELSDLIHYRIRHDDQAHPIWEYVSLIDDTIVSRPDD